MNELALRVGALVIFLGVLGGSFYAAEKAFGHPPSTTGINVPAGGLAVVAVQPALNAAPGTQVTFPLVLQTTGAGGVAQVGTQNYGNGTGARTTVTVPANGAAGGWLTLDVPPGTAAGPQRVVVQARLGNATATTTLSLNVLGSGPAAAIGDTAQVDYVGRFDNGTIFDTSVQSVGEAPFAKPDGFTRQQWQPLRLQLGDSAGTITGFWRGILGMQQGQSRSLHLAPADAYGNATQRLDVPRTQDVQRISQLFQRVQHVPRSVLGQYVNASSQVGDTFVVDDQQGNARTYRITQLDAGNATLHWEVREGDAFTVYPALPGQSRATAVTNETVQFRTDPANLNATLTWLPFWPNMTRITAVNETTITLTHSPPQGYRFALPNRSTQGEVVEVSGTTIIVEAPNEHPLAGKALNFDVTVRSLQKAA